MTFPEACATIPLPWVGSTCNAHTAFSDGTLTPSEVVRLALERDLSVLAVTDHDTTAGLGEAASAAEGTGLEIVPGVEFSAEYDGASLHVLALAILGETPPWTAVAGGVVILAGVEVVEPYVGALLVQDLRVVDTLERASAR